MIDPTTPPERAKRYRRRTFDQIRAEERATNASFIENQAEKLRLRGRGSDAALLDGLASTIRSDLASDRGQE